MVAGYVRPSGDRDHTAIIPARDFSSWSGGIELSPDGSRAYVTRQLTVFGGGLDVIDTTSKASLAFINLGIPGQLAIAPDGSRLYAGIDSTFVNTGYGAGFFPGRSVSVSRLSRSRAPASRLVSDGIPKRFSIVASTDA